MLETLPKPKNKGGRPRKIQPVITGGDRPTIPIPDGPNAMPPIGASGEPEIYGWKVSEGFYRIQLFPGPGEGDKLRAPSFLVGDHQPVTLYKGKTHIVPGAIMHNILDTVGAYPEDDLSDPQHPVRDIVKRTEHPHSEPVPATWQEFKAYKDAEAVKPSLSQYMRNKQR